jgi:hypothetical protein
MSWVCGGSPSEALEGRGERFEEIAEHPLDERRRCVTDATERTQNIYKQENEINERVIRSVSAKIT